MAIGWKDFKDIEESLSNDMELKSYGGQCRDGNMNGAMELSESMNNDDFIFHVKDHGDGYGHIIYNAYACGKPTIIRSSLYKDQLASELFNDKNSIDLDKISIQDASEHIKYILKNKEIWKEMSLNAYNSFIQNVNFAEDAEKVRQWLGTL
jgi:glycosyltransferase involved in cell wall biosynthesis